MLGSLKLAKEISVHQCQTLLGLMAAATNIIVGHAAHEDLPVLAHEQVVPPSISCTLHGRVDLLNHHQRAASNWMMRRQP